MKPDVKDLRACPEVGGTVMFPPDSGPYPFGVDPYWHGTKVRGVGWIAHGCFVGAHVFVGWLLDLVCVVFWGGGPLGA